MTSRLQYLRAAYNQGAESCDKGWERNSPYGKLVAEHYWYAGYDKIDFNEFHKFVKESRRTNKSSAS